MSRRKRAAETEAKIEAELERADDLYQAGRSDQAILVFEGVLARFELSTEVELKTRFWLACSLHTNGEIERAIAVVEEAPLDPETVTKNLRSSYRLVTRLGLLQIDAGMPLDEIEQTLERIRAIEADLKPKTGSRGSLVRGKLLAAKGRRSEAVRVLRRSLHQRRRDPESFAITAHMKVLVPCLIELGQLDAAARQLDAWEASNDPMNFKSPHLEIQRADWYRARGEIEKASRWAALARARGAAIDDVPGELSAARSSCQIALLAGEFAQSCSAQHKLFALRKRGSTLGRFAAELTSFDAHLTRAMAAFGAPVVDPVFGHATKHPVDVSLHEAAWSEWAAAKATHARCARLAKKLDAALRTRTYARALASRKQSLREAERAFADPRFAPPAPPPRAIESLTPPTWVEEAPVVAEYAGERWLLVPPADLAALVRHITQESELWPVLRTEEATGAQWLDLWEKVRFVGGGRFWLGPDTDGRRSACLHVEGFEGEKVCEALLEATREYFGDVFLGDGIRALGAREYRDAEAHLLRACRHLPTRYEAWERCAASQLALAKLDASLESCTRALELDSEEPTAWKLLARIFRRRGEREAARHSSAQHRARLQKRKKSVGDAGSDEGLHRF